MPTGVSKRNRYMKLLMICVASAALGNCSPTDEPESGLGSPAGVLTVPNGDLSDEELESFLRSHTISGNHAVAIKKRTTLGSQVAVSFLATIHGYPSNLSVCENLATEQNADQSLSVLPGVYYCEVLR